MQQIGRVLVSPLAVLLFASFAAVDVCVASISSPSAVAADKTVKRTRAKLAVKKTRAAKQAASKPVAAVVKAVESLAPQSAAGVLLKSTPALANAAPPPAPTQVAEYAPRVNPYLVHQQQFSSPPSPVPAWQGTSLSSGGPRMSMPHIPLFEQSILPKVQTVYPTGEKPLVVVTFKCPTELVGIDTPSTVILHKVVNGGMDVINRTNLLSFNMQQVCQ